MTTPKIVNLSDDGGTTFEPLPGNTASFNEEAAAIEDTIFGADFGSEEIGLINWSVEAQAFYKGFAGYLAELKQQGATTGFTGESMTLVSGKTFKIDDTTKEIWDRSVTFTVFDNAIDETANVESFNYLFGEITFKSTFVVTEPVTIDGSFFPTVALGKANAFTMTQTADSIESSDFGTVQANNGHRTFIQGLKTVTLDLSSFYDVTAGFRAALVARNELIVEIDAAGTGESIARGFFKVSNASQAGDVGAIEDESVSLTLQVPVAPSDPPFDWVHAPGSTLSTAVIIALTAWLDGTVIDVEYLYDGTNGITGKCIITDVTLAGGIDNMNEFSITCQGTAATTDVGTG